LLKSDREVKEIKDDMNASERIDKQIADLNDWRGEVLARLRKLILAADPGIIEEWKWMGTPTWSKNSVICIANPHKDKVKLTFSHGAAFKDPEKLFNSMLEGNQWRAIDIFEGDKINERALKNLLQEALAFDSAAKPSKAKKTRPASNVKTRSRG
jgi:hypothetical protein